ncbi:hypothetical protein [Nesterenkonia rhizosphaerae]|uniref:HNH endonuclease n=1 Tax=Nesterenkonia rhizosphaerae TaxID=1348272 RepID=A0ABP9FSQ1_9MICC
MTTAPLERLKAKVEEAPSGCWLWTGFSHKSEARFGYKRKDGTKIFSAVRAAWELHGNPWPEEGQELFSTCGEALCVNPDHRVIGHRSAGPFTKHGKTLIHQ